jgi:hypothetical protein
MNNISQQLTDTIDNASEALKELSSADWQSRRAPGKWTKKQILGHLIDSAANNHQRFVRVQFEDTPLIRYDGDGWVAVSDYENEPAEILIGLWLSYNRHLAYIITRIPEDKLSRLCSVGKPEPFTLEWIIKDYVRHMKHHLDQIIDLVN